MLSNRVDVTYPFENRAEPRRPKAVNFDVEVFRFDVEVFRFNAQQAVSH
jgi:hypothetical protein